MKQVPLAILLGSMAVTGVVMNAACQAGSGYERPEPSPTVSLATVHQVTESSPSPSPSPSLSPSPSIATEATPPSPSPSPSAAVQATPSSPSPAQEGVREPYILLYKVVTAGDYHALRISGDGRAEYTNYSRGYEIASRKQGHLDPGQVADLFTLLTDRGFFELAEEYTLQPPEGGELEIAVEDVYYWVGASGGQRENAVLSHEYARPLELQEITQALLDAALQLPDVYAYGQPGDAFLLAVDYRIMPYLRREEGMPSLELDEQSVKGYPLLEQALHHPCALVRVENLAGSKVGRFFTPGVHMMEVMFGGRQFVVLLLAQA